MRSLEGTRIQVSHFFGKCFGTSQEVAHVAEPSGASLILNPHFFMGALLSLLSPQTTERSGDGHRSHVPFANTNYLPRPSFAMLVSECPTLKGV